MRQFLSRIICLLVGTTASAASHATEPLHDRYAAGGLTGSIHPTECCWLTLPPSARLQEIRREQLTACSAIGGPVGMFQYRAGKLWLNRLVHCGGVIELGDVYPDMKGPVLADWLTGTFKATLHTECQDKHGVHFGRVDQVLQVKDGVVTSLSEERRMPPACVPAE